MQTFDNNYLFCNLSESFQSSWCDILTVDFLNYVPRHWLQYEPPTCESQLFLAFIYLVILVPGLTGNLAVLWLFCRVRALRTPTNLLTINIALADLLMNLKIPVFIYNSLNCGPSIGIQGCKFYGFLGGLSGTVTISSITVVSLERYITVTRSTRVKRRITYQNSFCLLTGVWLYSLLFSLPPLLGLVNQYVPEGYLTTCSYDYLSQDLSSKTFVLVFFFGAYVFPLFLITYAYGGIYLVARKSTRSFCEPIEQGSDNRRNQRIPLEQRLVKMVSFLILLWTFAWTPYAVVSLIGLFGNQQLLTPLASMVPALFAKCASVVDPYVYASSHPRFRKEMRKLLKLRRESSMTFTSRASFNKSNFVSRRMSKSQSTTSRRNKAAQSAATADV